MKINENVQGVKANALFTHLSVIHLHNNMKLKYYYIKLIYCEKKETSNIIFDLKQDNYPFISHFNFTLSKFGDSVFTKMSSNKLNYKL